MKKTFIIPVLVAGLNACNAPGNKEQQAPEPTPVKLVTASRMSYTVPVRATGLLGTREQMKLSFKTGGIIREVRAREGFSYRRGDVLAILDLSEVEARVDQARISLGKAERDLNRANNLYRDSVATLEQYQNARSAFELARSQLRIAEFNLRHSRITAPAEGKVQKVLVEANELIAPGHPVILFASTEDDWIMRAILTDKDIVRLSLGDSARLYIDAFPESEFAGEVSELASVADPVTGTYEAEIRILSRNQEFRTGFFARAEIRPSVSEETVMIPVECLVDAADRQAVVYVYDKGTVDQRRIRTGRIVGESVAVVEGLSAGEQIVSQGARYLKPGMQVRAINETP